jgi:hypothetical protein
MNAFQRGFEDELEKIAGKRQAFFQHIVHHPLFQTAGYGALAGEGAHALAGMGSFGKGVARLAHGPIGGGLGAGLIGASSAFLGAEGISALIDYMKRKK